METRVTFSPDREYVNGEVQHDQLHHISVSNDVGGQNVYIECNTREALYEFGRMFMQEALFGHGEIELYPLGYEGKWWVVNGVRLAENSARLFVRFPQEATRQETAQST